MLSGGVCWGLDVTVHGAAFVIVLGTAQDAGIPQAGCRCPACVAAGQCRELIRRPSCLGVVDPETGGRWLIDATPAFPEQLRDLSAAASTGRAGPPDGILLTHAHVGHYAGLVNLGREVMDCRRVPLWVMPRMKRFLRDNQPWASLIRQENVVLRDLVPGQAVALGSGVRVVPVPVPHRDESSETVAFEIEGPSSRVLWLPDIDGWDEWEPGLPERLASIDVAWLDGTFYDADELPGRDIAATPHPPIRSHLSDYARLSRETGTDLRLIHLNHSNPAATSGTPAERAIDQAGLSVSTEGERVNL